MVAASSGLLNCRSTTVVCGAFTLFCAGEVESSTGGVELTSGATVKLLM